jgi:hypothetical protein
VYRESSAGNRIEDEYFSAEFDSAILLTWKQRYTVDQVPEIESKMNFSQQSSIQLFYSLGSKDIPWIKCRK